MSLHRLFLAALALFLLTRPAAADDTTTALELIPDNALFVARIERPGKILQRLEQHFKALNLERFDEVKEILQSTPALRIKQFLQYLEQTYNRPWRQVLDDLTEHGITVGLMPGNDPKDVRVLGIVHGRDAELLERVYAASLEVMKNEAAQAETPVPVTTSQHKDITITSFGKDFHIARHGEHLIVGNRAASVHAALDRLLGAKGRTILANTCFKLKERSDSPNTLAWGWLDFVPLKAVAGKELDNIKLPTNNIIPHLLFGGLFDAYLRSDYGWFTLTDDGHGPALTITTPAGRDKSHEGSRALHMHDPAGPGIPPLLRPPGTLYTTSFYWDLGALYNQRAAIYKEDARKEFEDGEKKVKPFLAGTSLGQLFNQLGARHRFVVASLKDKAYTSKPKTPYPAFGFVAECRDVEKFYTAIALPLRGAGFLLSTQLSTKLIEETHAGCKIVAYRFNEVEKNRNYEQGVLFNFTPCFVKVGQFVVFSSSLELCRDLIDELQRTPPATKDTADARHEFSWSAFGEALAAEKAYIATELTLRHGGPVNEIETQITNLLNLLDKLGTVEASVSHSPKFQLELKAKHK